MNEAKATAPPMVLNTREADAKQLARDQGDTNGGRSRKDAAVNIHNEDGWSTASTSRKLIRSRSPRCDGRPTIQLLLRVGSRRAEG